MRRDLRYAASIALAAGPCCFTLAACGRGAPHADSAAASGSVAETTAVTNPGGPSGTVSGSTMVRGTVAAVSDTEVTVQGDSGTTRVRLDKPVQVFTRQSATLARVTPNSFIGVTTVKQPDGSEQASEIHVFPEALRGLGEGSRPMAPSTNGGTPSTMTNGSASPGGQTSGSTMSNGNVSQANGSTIVVQYPGGSKTVTVPPNTPVTEIVATSRPLAAGDQIVVVATRNPDGSLTSSRVLLAKK